MSELSNVFISYAREDEAAARDLYKRLVNAGLNPWFDKEKLVGGEDWDRAIKSALKQSDFVVLCLSELSVAKRGYLQREFKLALDTTQEMLASDIYLLPVRLDRCKVPDELSYLQWIDLYETDGWSKMLSAIQAGKARRAPAQSPDDADHTSWGEISQPRPMEGVHAQVQPDTNSMAEIGSLVPTLPRGITRPGRLRSLLAGQAALSPWLFLLLGIVFILLGNALTITGRSEDILRGVLEERGFGGLRFLHAYYYVIAVVATMLGGLFGSGWLLNLMYRDKVGVRLRLLTILVIVIAAASVANLIYGLFVEEKFEPVVEATVFEQLPDLYTLVGRVRDENSGGFRTEFRRGSRTQPWTSAQLLTAILRDPSHRGEEIIGAEELWTSLEYLENTRLDDEQQSGWGYWPGPGATITEIIAWVTVAQAAALGHEPGLLFSAERHATLQQRVAREADLLIGRQMTSESGQTQDAGAWGPITDTREPRTYSTLMAVWALVDAASVLPPSEAKRALSAAKGGIEWLLRMRSELGWSPRPRPGQETETFPGLTAQVVFVMARALEHKKLGFVRTDPGFNETVDFMLALQLAAHDSVSSLDTRTPDTDVHLGDTGYIIEGSTFLMYPWAVASLADISRAENIDSADRKRAARRRLELLLRWDDVEGKEGYLRKGYPYMLAETLVGVVHSVNGEL